MGCGKMKQCMAAVIPFMDNVGIRVQNGFQFRQQLRFGTVYRYILNAYVPCMLEEIRGSRLAHDIGVIRRHHLETGD